MFFMKKDDFIEKRVDVDLFQVFSEADRMLAIEVDHKISSKVALPVHFDDEVVVSRVKLDSYCTISIAIDEVIYISAKSICGFIDFEDY